MTQGWKKAVSVMLCVAMILSVSSVTVFADGETNPPATEQTQQETETQKPENGETEETKPENEIQPEGEGQDETKPEGETEKPDGVSEAAKSVIAQLEALPKLDDLTEGTDTEALKNQVESAKKAFDALTEEEKASISEELKGNLADLDIFVTNFIVNTPTAIPETESDKIVSDQGGIVTFTEDGNGSGTVKDPYQVATASEFNEKVEAAKGTVYIQFADNFSEGEAQLSVPAEKTVVLDLNGQKVTLSKSVQVLGNLTLKDSKTDGTLKTEVASAYLIEVGNAETEATLVIENGTYESSYRVIKNKGSVTVNNGTLKVNSTVDNTGAIANYGKEKDTVTNHNVECTIKNGTVNGGQFGVALFGKGIEEGPNNDAVVLNINGGTISAEGQGIATNASGGAFAGFTVNMTAGEVNGGTGTGMYLPAIGEVNIHGGKVHGDNQGIRIAAGELNITGGTITNNEARNGGDLISGGSGGTAGAIVAGKAGDSGYVGDLVINVSGSATIENQATGENDAIVISDKNMKADAYKNNKIEVNVSGANVNGNVYQTTSTTSSEKDGGNVSLSIDNTTITGNVEKTGAGDVTITGSTIEGNLTGSAAGDIDISDSTVAGQPVTNSKPFEVDGDKKYATLAEAIQDVKNGGTIKLLTDIPNATGVAVWATDNKNFTVDFAGHIYTLVGPGEGSQGYKSQGFHFEKGNTIKLKDGTIKVAPGAKDIYMIIQNYADLTLENMQIYAENMLGNGDFPLSFNNGNILFSGNTSVYTPSNDAIAFDVCKFSNYPGVTVTFDKNYTGTINGRIVYDAKDANTHKLIINGNGTFGKVDVASTGDANAAENGGITISAGSFAESVKEYVVPELNYELHSYNGRYTYYHTLEEAKDAAQGVGGVITDVDTGNVVVTVKPDDSKPSKPSKPSNGGSSNSGSSNSGTTVDKEEEDYNEFWDKVIDRINKADEGDTVTVHAGNYDKMPNKVMKALEKNGVGLIIKYNGGEIEIPAGEAVNKSNKLFWSFKELGNYVFAVEDNNEQNDKQDNEQSNGSENNAQSNTTTEQKPSGTVETKPNPQTGSEDYVGLAAALAVTAGVAATVIGAKKKK